MDYYQTISYSLNTFEEKEFKRILKKKNLVIPDSEEYYNEYIDSEHKLDEIVKVFTDMFPIDPISHFEQPEGFDGRKRVYFNSAQPEIEDFGDENEMLSYAPTIKLNIEPYKNLKNKSIFFGERQIFGEYSKEFEKSEVKKVAQGLTHEVVLLNDGSLAKRGSNVNGQLDFDRVVDIKDVVCGRFFTAFLKYDGSVEVFGHCFQSEPQILKNLPELDIIEISKDCKMKEGYHPLDIKLKEDENGRYFILNMYDGDQFIGELYNSKKYDGDSHLAAGSLFEEFLASTIKYEYYLIVEKEYGYTYKNIDAFSIRNLDWLGEGNNFVPVNQWQNIVSIESNYDGLIGVDKEGSKFAFGTII